MAAKLKRAKKWKPFKAPVKPPSNTYDPALDSQQRAGERGLLDLTQDVERVGQRSLSDYLLGQENLNRQRGEGLADLLRRRQGVDRSFDQLANQQAQGARAAGVRGGALVQALQKRTANKQLEVEPINIAEGRLNEETDRRLGALSTDYQRAQEDNTLVKLPRAQREQQFFNQDVSAQRFFQAKQTGYKAPTKPKNEFNRHGLTYQVGGLAGPVSQRTYVLPSGQRFSRNEWVRYIRGRGK